MRHQVSSLKNTGSVPPQERYRTRDAAWLQWAWQVTQTMPKTRSGLEESTRVSPYWSLSMSSRIDDLVRTFSSDPSDRSIADRQFYRGVLTPERRLTDTMVWSFYLWMGNWLEGEGRFVYHEVLNSMRVGIADPANRVIDFLKLLHMRLERQPFAVAPDTMRFGSRQARVPLTRVGGRR